MDWDFLNWLINFVFLSVERWIMSNGTIGKGNLTKIESFDFPSSSYGSVTFFLSSETEKRFRGTKQSTENPTN